MVQNSVALSGLYSGPHENDLLLVHSVQSLSVTLVIRFAAPRSHVAFRVARIRCMAFIALESPKCTLAVAKPIAWMSLPSSRFLGNRKYELETWYLQ